jgi:hypothetical protein
MGHNEVSFTSQPTSYWGDTALSLLMNSTSSDALGSILIRMRTQSAGFDDWTERSIETLKRTAWAANETKIFMRSVSELDRDTLQKLVEKLKPTVEKAKQDIAILVEELRTFNTGINTVGERDSLLG